MYVYCVERFVHIECYNYCSRRGVGIWLNPFATVLFNMCSAVTVECCVLCPCCVLCLVCLLLCKEDSSSPVSLQLLLLISVCMFIVLKDLFILSVTIIAHAGGGGHLVEPLCYCVV